MTEETKQLDAHDTLLLMGEAFDGADELGYAYVVWRHASGMCSAIRSLRSDGRITGETANELMQLIHLALKGDSNKYLFPLTREGARQRAAWCREQAAKLRPVEGPKVCDEAPKVRTVADALREMPVGQRFRRPKYKSDRWFQKRADDLFSSNAGEFYRTHDFYELDTPHDDPDNGIIILSTPDAVPPTRVRCWHDDEHNQLWAMKDGDCGLWFYPWTKAIAATCETITSLEHPASGLARASITPAAALDLLKDWPEGRERFLTYCREHPPVEEPKPTVDVICKGCGNVMRGLTPNNIAFCMDCGTDNPNPLNLEQPVYAQVMGRGALSQPEQPAGVVVTREWLSEVASVLSHCQVHWFACVKTEADPNVNGLWKVLGEWAGRLADDARRKAGG